MNNSPESPAEKLSEFEVLVGTKTARAKGPVAAQLAHEDGEVLISEYGARPEDVSRRPLTTYDPQMGRYFYKLPDGTKVIV